MDQKVPMKEKIGYGLGAIGIDLSYGLCVSFFMNYATDVLLVSSFYMGIVLALARIWDGINDPIMGTIVNNTRTKMGRFRPWILIGAVSNAVVLFFMFTNPGFSVSSGTVNYGLYAYVAVFYVLWGMTYTMVDIPYWSFVPALTSDPKERNVISSIPRFFSGLGQLLVAGLTPIFLKKVSQTSFGVEKGYSVWAALLGVLFILGMVITASTTRERIVSQTKEKFDLKRAFHVIRNNDQLLVFILTAILFNTGWYLTNGLSIYFFKYIAEDVSYMTYFAVISGAGQAVGLFGLSFLSKIIGKRNTVRTAIIVAISGYIGMFLVSRMPSFSFALFAIFGFICCLGIGCMFTAETSMLADIVDYGEYSSGERTDSIVFSMKSFLLKIAQSVQALIIGVGLKLCRYQENVIPQPVSSKNGIAVMMFAIPPVLALASFIFFSSKYRLHGELMDKITESMLSKKRDKNDME
ncbi:MAG: glycoside-pentoside-hexuronide (GPH):cation symporter [Clostridiales bacterium]|nr:glycoside-pentoside-hexuronide (GPH):cation symporter [Clostridiales bacterium]